MKKGNVESRNRKKGKRSFEERAFNIPMPANLFEVEKHPDDLEGSAEEEDDDDSVLEEDNFCQWEVKEGGVYIPAHQPRFVKQIPSGYYKIRYDQQNGIFFLKDKKIKTDELIKLPIGDQEEVINDIQDFWGMKSRYQKYSYLHKRGILMYGPPGSGKTCILNLLIEDLIKRQEGIIFSIENVEDLSLYSDFSQIFREIEPNRPLIVIIEDIDGLLDGGRNSEKMLLNILDGINQIESVAYIATTNYPENLEQRLLNRPGRFDRRFSIGYPNAETRAEYFKNKICSDDLESFDIKEMVKKTKGFTIAHCKEVFSAVVIRGRELESVVQEMSEMNSKKLHSTEELPNKKKPGFLESNESENEEDNFEGIDWEKLIKEIKGED